MQYMLLIYEDEQHWQSLPEPERQRIYGLYGDYAKALEDAGLLRGGSELQPTTTATTVRVKGGRPVTTDGPFAETKEQLGGYFLIEAPSLDEALAWARRCPGAEHGAVEVRPLADSGGM